MIENNIIILDKKRFEEIKNNIKKDGASKLHIVADFDKTLTSCFVDGKKSNSLIAVLRDENYLTPDYTEKAQALYDKYHSYESDPNLSLEEKKRLMHEWWSAHYDLLIKSGLSKSDLEKVAQSTRVAFRPGAMEFFDFLHKYNIPAVILSAAGVGTETISLYLKRFNKFYDNIHIVSNTFIWGDDDKVKGVSEPIVHTFNKDYASVKQFSFYEEIKDKKNVILLGDSVSDGQMLNGFDYDNLIKIGFLNENSKCEIATYKEVYDIIILRDGAMDYVVESFKKAFDVIIPEDGVMDFVNGLMGELVMAGA
ncbi:MAG: haloacid dehalogenase-like hydrolase [bacterium]